MKFTVDWLKQHLDTNVSDAEICEKLTNIGLELEEFTDKSQEFAPFKVAYVESAEQHPDADKLKVCLVKTEDVTVQVVCGATNARTGMKGIFAPSGTYIPGLDVTLSKAKIRGVESNGMLVSEREMCLSDEHEGIIEVDDKFDIGTPMSEVFGLNEKVIEIGLTPNRADCAGVRGIARDLAAAGLGKLKDQDESAVKGTFDSPIGVRIEDEEGCPLFYGRYIRNVKNGPSPDWLRNMIEAVGGRSISALVDITNLMTLGQCRPMHVYDADKLKGNIVVKATKGGEKLEALNDKSYTLTEGAVGIHDESGLIGLGGIVGGVSTGCEYDTVNVFVESAYFDPMRIARTGRNLSVSSDARYRFERGVDPEFTLTGMEIATQLILDLCGTEQTEVSHVVKAGEVPEWKREIAFDPHFTEKLCGVDVPEKDQIDILTRLGFYVQKKGSVYRVQPPSWRVDVFGAADLVEEVVRIHGFEKIKGVSVRSPSAVARPAETKTLMRTRIARAAMTAIGFDECVTWSFMPKALATHFGSNDNQALTLSNPISSELDQMRPSILPNLIEAAGRNGTRGFSDVALCEVGPVFRSQKSHGQDMMAAGLRSGNAVPRNWAEDLKERAVDAYDAKADAMRVLEAVGAPAANAQISRDAPDYYHPGRSGVLRLGKNVIAQFGEIHPAILDEMGIKTSAVGFEVFLQNIPEARKKGSARSLLELSPLQPLTRDFAFVVKEDVSAEDVLKAAKSADKKLITDADVFDVYQGKGVDIGHKSLALSITIQPVEETLKDDQIDAIMQKVIEAVSSKCGGVLRG
ncbi:MAG: phenylalanine--tRNA ligase subunit beta [Alphaproteobacteria bacterium]|nr:phenylalanine--tRNA ligase subunit beta [Alphaproteobacteria bacterium]